MVADYKKDGIWYPLTLEALRNELRDARET